MSTSSIDPEFKPHGPGRYYWDRTTSADYGMEQHADLVAVNRSSRPFPKQRWNTAKTLRGPHQTSPETTL